MMAGISPMLPYQTMYFKSGLQPDRKAFLISWPIHHQTPQFCQRLQCLLRNATGRFKYPSSSLYGTIFPFYQKTTLMKPEKHLVVYADDDSDDRELVAEAFSRHDESIDLKTFENGNEIYSYLVQLPNSQSSPCLIVLDINMPLMNGKEVLSQLRKHRRYAKTPVILFTTSSVHSDAAYAQSHHARLITKPSNYEGIRKIAQQFASTCADEVKSNLTHALRLA
jgi:CheY-like chemotaxis protein